VLLLLDEVDDRLRIKKGVRRGADNRVGDGITGFLSLLAGVNGDRGRAGLTMRAVGSVSHGRESSERRNGGFAAPPAEAGNRATRSPSLQSELPIRGPGHLRFSQSIQDQSWHFSSLRLQAAANPSM